MTVYPLKTNGLNGAVIRIDDVTKRVRMEEMMIQTEKMISLGGFSAGMAHEIKNPLAGIIQNMQVLKNRLFSDLPANHRAAKECGVDLEKLTLSIEKRGFNRTINAVTESGLRASKLVENMLSFSSKSDKKEFSFQDICDLLDRSIELSSSDYDLKKGYDFKQIKTIKDYAKNVPNVFLCEPGMIQQVFMNTLQNWAHAMAEKKEKQSCFKISIKKNDDSVLIEIEDNGPGIAEDVKKRIFEPFCTTKKRGLGRGLGLSVSNFIITDNHGGTFDVESTPGVGTKFIIKLPIQQSEL